MKISSESTTRIEKIKKEADKRDLTYFVDNDGKHCLCDIYWIGRFRTLEDVEEYLGIMEEK